MIARRHQEDPTPDLAEDIELMNADFKFFMAAEKPI
jgi:hypothetical protein